MLKVRARNWRKEPTGRMKAVRGGSFESSCAASCITGWPLELKTKQTSSMSRSRRVTFSSSNLVRSGGQASVWARRQGCEQRTKLRWAGRAKRCGDMRAQIEQTRLDLVITGNGTDDNSVQRMPNLVDDFSETIVSKRAVLTSNSD